MHITLFQVFIMYPALALIFNIVDMIAYLIAFVFWGKASESSEECCPCRYGHSMDNIHTGTYQIENIDAYERVYSFYLRYQNRRGEKWLGALLYLSFFTLPPRVWWKVWVATCMVWVSTMKGNYTRAVAYHHHRQQQQRRQSTYNILYFGCVMLTIP